MTPASHSCAALRFDDWIQRWSGDLHFPDGFITVYLEPGENDNPTYFIKDLDTGQSLGVLYQYSDHFTGQLNTAEPIALLGKLRDGRFVLRVTHDKKNPPRSPVTLRLKPRTSPYRDGQDA